MIRHVRIDSLNRRRNASAPFKSILIVLGGLALLYIGSFIGQRHRHGKVGGIILKSSNLETALMKVPVATSIVLDPQEIRLSNTLVHLQIPPKNQQIAGMVLLFHGCNHDGIDWFQLPEEQAIVKFLLAHSHAVLAFSSQQRTGSRCWSNEFPASRNEDAVKATDAFHQIRTDKNINLEGDASSLPLPIYGIGASSGGTFVTILHQMIGFHGMEIIVSPGHPQAIEWMATTKTTTSRQHPGALLPPHPPRVAFVYMVKDTKFAGKYQIEKRIQTLEKATTTTTATSSIVLVQTFACEPKPITAPWLSDRIEHLSLSQAMQLIELFSSSNLQLIDKESGMLQVNPRQHWNRIVQAVSFHKDLSKSLDRIIMAGIEESLNLADGSHELTSDYIADVYSFWKTATIQ